MMRNRIGPCCGSSRAWCVLETLLCVLAASVPAAAQSGVAAAPIGFPAGPHNGEPAAFAPLEPAPPVEAPAPSAPNAAPDAPSPSEAAPTLPPEAASPADASPTVVPAPASEPSLPATKGPETQGSLATDPSPDDVARPLSNGGWPSEPRSTSLGFMASSESRSEVDRLRAESVDKAPELPFGGLQLDIGVPDGLMLSAVVRPAWWARLHAGAGSNSLSPGIRAGAALTPFGSGPSLALEAGHYFEGDANGLVEGITGAPSEAHAVLRRIGYDFANAHLGLEFGQERVQFFVHGGITYLRTTVHDVNAVINEDSTSQQSMTIDITKDPTVVAMVPSVKIGIIAYLL